MSEDLNNQDELLADESYKAFFMVFLKEKIRSNHLTIEGVEHKVGLSVRTLNNYMKGDLPETIKEVNYNALLDVIGANHDECLDAWNNKSKTPEENETRPSKFNINAGTINNFAGGDLNIHKQINNREPTDKQE